MFFTLAVKSLGNRKGSAALTCLAMTVSVVVLLGVEHIRHQAKGSFANTVSGIDLIVGARTSSINLLMYSVFRVGAPTNNLSWSSFNNIASNKYVDWVVPISLGDSHKGYRVMGTSSDYFKHFRYANAQALQFSKGHAFSELYDVVLGAKVAKQLGYRLGDKLVLAHGIAETSFSLHENHPFTVVGILSPTGTPIDQTLHISLEGIEAIHVDWQPGTNNTTDNASHPLQENGQRQNLQPKEVTALLLGLKSRLATFKVQRAINEYDKEPLTAILPGVALTELWQIMSVLENTLRLVSILILISALLGLAAMLLASIRERERELQLLRVVGASPLFCFFLIQLEAVLISIVSFAAGLALLSSVLWSVQDIVTEHFGIHMSLSILTQQALLFLALVIAATFLVASVPSWQAYRHAKHI